MIDYLDTALTGRDWIFIVLGVFACLLLWDIAKRLQALAGELGQRAHQKEQADEFAYENLLREVELIKISTEQIEAHTAKGENYD